MTAAASTTLPALMIKPVGAACESRCRYCYYRNNPTAGHDARRPMAHDTLEALFSCALSAASGDLNVIWQGGEPTEAGLPYFERALRLQNKHCRPGQRVRNGLQTNGAHLDDDWCRLLREYDVLVGLSLDGTRALHDQYRLGSDGNGTHAATLRALKLLQRHGVEHNVVCVLTDQSVSHPLELLSTFADLEVRWLQFIPAIEWNTDTSGSARLESFSPSAEAYGTFLCSLFDAWFERFRDTVSIRLFDSWLSTLVTGTATLCNFATRCSDQLTIEQDGVIYACDHFVEPRWRLGKIVPDNGNAWLTSATEGLARFAGEKERLADECCRCQWLSICNGGCPKHRPDFPNRLQPSVLCHSYRALFEHAHSRIEWLASFLRKGSRPPRPTREARTPGRRRLGRNEPCSCNSGRKYKRCCGAPGVEGIIR